MFDKDSNNKRVEITDFKVGDKLFQITHGIYVRVLTITRLTKKWIICEDVRLVIRNNKILDYCLSENPYTYYEKATTELITLKNINIAAKKHDINTIEDSIDETIDNFPTNEALQLLDKLIIHI